MSDISAPPVSLQEFLTARLDEIQADYSLPRPHGFSTADAWRGAHRMECAALIVSGIGTYDMDCDCGESARVLADIAAKRRIIAYHEPTVTDPHECGVCGESPSPCRTVRLLGSPFRDHSEWREEWA